MYGGPLLHEDVGKIMGNEVEIKNITAAEDAAMASIVRMNLAAYGLNIPGTAYFDPELERLSAFYDADPSKRAYYVAVDSAGTVLGGAGFAEFEGLPQTAELQKLYLIDAAKGKGLGKRLTQLVADGARVCGYRQLYLETHTNLQAAIGLYEHLGFKRIEKSAVVGHNTMNRFYVLGL